MDAVYADAGEAQIVPAGVKDLRACTSCNLVKTAHQWQQDGCENCGWTDGWQDATTNRFHGCVLTELKVCFLFSISAKIEKIIFGGFADVFGRDIVLQRFFLMDCMFEI
jgi:hypothetical protein